MKKKHKRKIKLIILTTLFLFTLILLIVLLKFYYYSFINNVKIIKDSEYIYIPTGSTYEDVLKILTENKILKDVISFEILAELKGYKKNVKPGRYKIKRGMNTNKIINLLKYGLQEPVSIKISSFINPKYLSKYLGKNLELNEQVIYNTLKNEEYAKKFGFTSENFWSMFLTGNYSIIWNISLDSLFLFFYTEYKKFWNEERKKKLEKLKLTDKEVIILASIVQLETSKFDEMPRIAGVYYNRLKKNMLLQADPTIIAALGHISIKRITKEHLSIDSKYNTYKNKGLPPGPICLPNRKVIDAVLNLEFHNFLYFCAKTDGSGYHVFAENYYEHLKNAKKYWKKLNELNIK